MSTVFWVSKDRVCADRSAVMQIQSLCSAVHAVGWACCLVAGEARRTRVPQLVEFDAPYIVPGDGLLLCCLVLVLGQSSHPGINVWRSAQSQGIARDMNVAPPCLAGDGACVLRCCLVCAGCCCCASRCTGYL